MRYPLTTSTWDKEELEAINSVVVSGNFTMGRNVRDFEQKFADFFGSKYCLMVNSGSSANLLGIASLFYTEKPLLKKGDEVIVPAISWPTTYYPLHQYGLKVKFIDVCLDTLNLDIESLKSAITEKTKLIFAVNLLGNPCEYEEIQRAIQGKDIILIEDNCESMGAKYQTAYTGTIGLFGTYSTFYSHHISTMEGGLILTDNEELYHIMLSLRAHGWTRDLPTNNSLNHEVHDKFMEKFNFVLPGYNLRPIEMSAAVGKEQLIKFPYLLESRQKNATVFHELMSKNKGYIIQKEIGTSSWFAFSLIISPNNKLTRYQVIQRLTKGKIESRPIVAGNFVNNSVIKYFDYEISGELKNAEYIHDNGFYIGNHGFDLTSEIEHLHAILDEV